MRSKSSEPLSFLFTDDGAIPNNATLPMLVYRGVVDLSGTHEPAERVEALFKANGWGHNLWRNGIYPYVHYHSSIHEALGVARGRAKVRFGGAKGEEIDIAPGDVVVLPAGTGHQCVWEGPDLQVIGAYPPSGRYDLCRGSKYEREQALVSIPKVPMPDTDPVAGKDGPLLRLWRATVS